MALILMRQRLLGALVVVVCAIILSAPPITAATKPAQPQEPDFKGTWEVDRKASDSLEPLMQKIGASVVDQKLVAVAPLKATFQRSENVLTVATRAPNFTLDETLYLDGRSHPTNIQLLGATTSSSRTTWSSDHSQLIVTYRIKTKQEKEGQLTIKRYLTNEGKTEVVAYTLKLDGEPDESSARQVWNKAA